MMKINRRMFLGVAMTALAACASSQNLREQQAVTILEVDNRATLDMNIYVLRSSERIRIGTAMALRTSQFKIPPDLIFGATPLRFLADPIGANRLPVSEEITVAAGDTVVLEIPAR
jgi:hypothetical protein